VEVYQLDRQTQLIASSKTNVEGEFTIGIRHAVIDPSVSKNSSEIFFKIFSNEQLIRNTLETLNVNLELDTQPIMIEVDASSIKGNEPVFPLSIIGKGFSSLTGYPLAGAKIKVFTNAGGYAD